MDDLTKGKIEGLKHAIFLCDSRYYSHNNPPYKAACDAIKLQCEAAIERLEEGGDTMHSEAHVQ